MYSVLGAYAGNLIVTFRLEKSLDPLRDLATGVLGFRGIPIGVY